MPQAQPGSQARLRRLQHLNTIEVGAKSGGNMDTAVGVLVVFEERDEGSGRGDDGVVEGVTEVDVAVGVAVAEVEATGLEGVEATGTMRFGVAVA